MDTDDEFGKSDSKFRRYLSMGKDTHGNNMFQDCFTDPSMNQEKHASKEILRSVELDEKGEDEYQSGTSEDVKYPGSMKSPEMERDAADFSTESFLLNTEADNSLWLPPQPEDAEDETGLSVANNDEDDYYTSGTEWGQPNYFSSFDGHNDFILSDREKRKKVKMEAMHSQFKRLVSRFLEFWDIAPSGDEDQHTWVDIVSSLSWQAAQFVKPDVTEGMGMDPGFYVKVKCIACGSRAESQVIKGLVFKKNTAHKHMPTSFKNARLLLLKGVLGERVSGLSSLRSMNEEKDYMKSVINIIESCHPNVVLVEKTAPRDAQESLLAKKITLVSDMKLRRLERIARCIGSRIIDSADIAMNTDLKKCDFFHVEKFIEDLNHTSDGGKKASKTLMFFEGYPKPLGCTIILKGAPSDELKKIKHVTQFTVFAAYHLILETSFLADQTSASFGMNVPDKQIDEEENDNILPGLDNMIKEVPSSEFTVEVRAPSGLSESTTHERLPSKSHIEDYVEVMEYETDPPESAHDNYIPLLPGQFLSLSEESSNKEQSDNLLVDPADLENAAVMLESQSILVLFSSRGTSKESVCEQTQLSRIKYYGINDMALGRFLQDILLNKEHICPMCHECSEAHVYSYTHQNGKLTVQIRQLPQQSHLPGEKDGKLWMWTRCLKCQHGNDIPQSTKRVIMSTSALGLSFGKFLDLSFSNHSATKILSRCGHLLHRDCLRFFGFGSKIAMFSYSPVEIYMACRPPPVIEFNSSIKQEWFEMEAEEVKHVGEEFFLEVRRLLHEMKLNFSRLPLCLPGFIKGFEVEAMLKQEKEEFEASLLMAMKCHGHLGKSASETVNLTYLRQELLLGIYAWDCRINYLHSFRLSLDIHGGSMVEEMPISDKSDDPNNIGSGTLAEDIPVEDSSIAKETPLNGNIRTINIELGSGDESSGFLNDEALSANAISVGGMNDSTLLPISSEENSISPHLDGNYSGSKSFTSISNAHNTSVCLKQSDYNKDFDVKNESLECDGDFHPGFVADGQYAGPVDIIWLPFPEMHGVFLREGRDMYMKKFEDIHRHAFEYLPSLYQKISLEDREYLHFPLGSERIILSVREEEISSIVACALTKLQEQYSFLETPEMELEIDDEKGNDNTEALSSDVSVPSSARSSNASSSFERLQSFQSVSSLDEVSSLGLDNLSESGSLHLNAGVSDDKATGKCKFSVVCIYAKQFHSLRKHCCSSELDYILSLSRCKKWDAQGGKSKAMFLKTLDDRFIIKEIKRTELDSFLKFGPEYFNHISFSLKTGNQMSLAKIFGLYQVKQIKGGKEFKYDLMVMENLLYGRNVTRTYDLKGAVRARYIADPNKPEKVLLDQNFIEDMGLSPVYIGGRTKVLLQRSIWNDTSFLTAVNVMDYSLLVGVDRERRELICGIIDYLRQYTWDKQLETWAKSSLAPKNSQPTVISPKEYKKRFRKFMTKHFLTVPDSWASDSFSDHTI